MKASHLLSLSVAAVVGGIVAAPTSATVVDDFSSYATGAFPSANWNAPVPALNAGQSESITVQSNAGNLVGNHLQVTTLYPTNGTSIALPVMLQNDGDYVQYAAKVVSGKTYAGMHLLAAHLSDPNTQPPGAVGIAMDGDWGHNAFTAHHGGVYNYDVGSYDPPIPWVDGATPQPNTWYFLRATMRDNGGAAGVIDSYDINIYDASMTPLASKLGVAMHGGEGPITYVGLVQNEQSGTATATVLFDQITVQAIPEPASIGLLAGISALALGRRRAA